MSISFLWCHVRHLNLIKKHPEKIKKEDKRLANNLNYEKIEFLKILFQVYIFLTKKKNKKPKHCWYMNKKYL